MAVALADEDVDHVVLKPGNVVGFGEDVQIEAHAPSEILDALAAGVHFACGEPEQEPLEHGDLLLGQAQRPFPRFAEAILERSLEEWAHFAEEGLLDLELRLGWAYFDFHKSFKGRASRVSYECTAPGKRQLSLT